MSTALPLATRALRGFLWNGGASVIQLGTILILYAFVPKAGMGHFEWALALIMLLALIGDLGLSAALVQPPEATEVHFDSAFWINLAWGIILTATVFATAPILAPYLGGEAPATFVRVMRTLCLLIPCASVSGIFRARLQRDLNFPAIALSELVSVFTFGAVVLTLLFLSSDPDPLIPVIGSVFREVGLLCSLAFSARWRPRLYCQLQALRQIFSFALHITGARVVAYLNTKLAYVFVFGPLGATAQAYYSLAERLTLQPLTRLATTIQRVSFPTFSAIQDDDPLLRSGYLHSIQGLLMTMGPILVGIFVFAPEISALLHAEPMWPVLRFLAVATILKVVGTTIGSIFMAKGKANWSFYWSLFSMAVLIPAMYFYGLPRGVEGVALVIAASSLLFLLVSQYLANRLIDLTFATYLTALLRPGLVVGSGCIVLLLARPLLPESPLAALALGALLSGTTTLIALALFARKLCRTYWLNLRGA